MLAAEKEALHWGFNGIYCVTEEVNDSALRLYINQLDYQVIKANEKNEKEKCIVLFKQL